LGLVLAVLRELPSLLARLPLELLPPTKCQELPRLVAQQLSAHSSVLVAVVLRASEADS
jgi:hypothetical protein